MSKGQACMHTWKNQHQTATTKPHTEYKVHDPAHIAWGVETTKEWFCHDSPIVLWQQAPFLHLSNADVEPAWFQEAEHVASHESYHTQVLHGLEHIVERDIEQNKRFAIKTKTERKTNNVLIKQRWHALLGSRETITTHPPTPFFSPPFLFTFQDHTPQIHLLLFY